MSNKLTTIIVVIVLVIIGFFIFKDKSIAPTDLNIDSNMSAVGEEAMETSPTNVKEFTVDAASFSFSPSTMEVNLGDTVKITVRNLKGTHDLNLDEFTGATTDILDTGGEQTITFIADKVGAFEYYCSVGNHRAQGMVGTLTVK